MEHKKPGPKCFDPEVFDAATLDIGALDHVKRRTWGTQAIYEIYGGIIPKEFIRQTIKKERSNLNSIKRKGYNRYEFVAPDIAWSDDFKFIKGGARILRVQDDFARVSFGYQKRDCWKDDEVSRYVSETFQRYGLPYFFKHDLGPEFKSGLFQSMLKGVKVIALPSPPYYPQANGKHERVNEVITQWLLPIESDYPSEEEYLNEIRDSLIDNNECRPKEILGHKTPQYVYMNCPRILLDRSKIYSEWEYIKTKIMHRKGRYGTITQFSEFEAMRIAAYVILKRYKLIRYIYVSEALSASAESVS